MDREQVEALCESLPGAWPDTPWEDDLVYKLGPTGKGKIFCFLGGGTTELSGISIKVDPALVPLLHQKYEAVSSPAYSEQAALDRRPAQRRHARRRAGGADRGLLAPGRGMSGPAEADATSVGLAGLGASLRRPHAVM